MSDFRHTAPALFLRLQQDYHKLFCLIKLEYNNLSYIQFTISLHQHEVVTASRRRWRAKFKPRIERRVRTHGRTCREGAGYGDRFQKVTLRRSGHNPEQR